jgi:3-hydroxyisobutyrate dehydrogenase-like beta-hydroxyacid dehydrogenase
VQSLAEAGAEVAASAQAVARETTRSICMVETTTQAESVIVGETGFIQTAKPGHIVICMSTADPFKLKDMAAKLAAKNITVIDAPVSGGTKGAAEATLSIIVGGEKAAFEACRGLFDSMGGNVAIAEGLVMGTKAGLDIEQLYQMLTVSSGDSFALRMRGRRMIDRNFAPSGTVDISYKDQELETAFAKQLGVPVLLANVSQQAYQMARAAGLNKEEGSAVVKVYERLTGVTVGQG